MVWAGFTPDVFGHSAAGAVESIRTWLSSPFPFSVKDQSAKHLLPQPPPPDFHIHPWRWHHLSIDSTLARLASLSTSRSAVLCPAHEEAAPSAASIARLARADLISAFSFLIDANWAVHDFVEASFLIPFVTSRSSSLSPSRSAQLSASRARLRSRREQLRGRFERWRISSDEQASRQCRSELASLVRGLHELRADAVTLFAAAERAIASAVATDIPQSEQQNLNMAVVRALDGGRARVALVLFDELLETGRANTTTEADMFPASALDVDRKNFRKLIPKHVRVLVPVWRNRMVAKHVRFLDPLYNPSERKR